MTITNNASKTDVNPKEKLPEIQDDSQIKVATPSDYVEIVNTCTVTIYVQIKWPNQGPSNFQMEAGGTHSLFVGTGGNPCGCFSTRGQISDCGNHCVPLQPGHRYGTCS